MNLKHLWVLQECCPITHQVFYLLNLPYQMCMLSAARIPCCLTDAICCFALLTLGNLSGDGRACMTSGEKAVHFIVQFNDSYYCCSIYAILQRPLSVLTSNFKGSIVQTWHVNASTQFFGPYKLCLPV